jgi:hypothetical protein
MIATVDIITADIVGCQTDLHLGEVVLKARSNQLKILDAYEGDSCSYLVGGMIKLYGLENLGVILLETSLHFDSTDKLKRCFTHHKILFGGLAMLKSIAKGFFFFVFG